MTVKMSRLWVDPRFKKKLKLEAAKNDTSVLNYTKYLACKDDPVLTTDKKKYKKNGGLFGSFKF